MRAYEVATVHCTRCGLAIVARLDVKPGDELPEPEACDCGAPASTCCLVLRDYRGYVDLRVSQPWTRDPSEASAT